MGIDSPQTASLTFSVFHEGLDAEVGPISVVFEEVERIYQKPDPNDYYSEDSPHYAHYEPETVTACCDWNAFTNFQVAKIPLILTETF